MENKDNPISGVLGDEYKYGFVTDIESDTFAKGLNENVVRAISRKKMSPSLCLAFGSRHIRNG